MTNLNAATIANIAEATDVNDHTSALATLAYALNNEWMISEIIKLDNAHLDLGWMTEEMMNDRRLIARSLMDCARLAYSNFDEIDAAY